MLAKTALALTSLCSVALAGVRSGKAEAEWIAASATYQPGKPVHTGLRLVLDEGWHTYWVNPGEGGMVISVKWELPARWSAGELEYPVPIRFTTGGLAGFGYEGTVVFPVAFTPPPDAAGKVKLTGNVSWLTCNDESCVPGNAKIELTLDAGPAAATEATEEIEETLAAIPRSGETEFSMTVTEKPETLVLTLEASSESAWNPGDSEVFAATPQVIAPAAKIQFIGGGRKWTAEVPKSEYATQPIGELKLVFAKSNQEPPRFLLWKAP